MAKSKKSVKKPVKKPTKKAAAKKAAVKKPVAKKASAKKPAAKKAAAKKASKPVAKKTAAKKAVKKPVEEGKKRKPVSPVIIKKPVAPELTEEQLAAQTKRSVDLTMMIAMRMKRSDKKADAAAARERPSGDFGKRPTTRASGKTTARFPAADLKEFKRRLLEAREKALSGVDAMKATGFNESDDHEADGGDGTNQTLRLQALGQMGNIHRTIMQIDEALHRIDEGTYGVCTSCGQLIRKPRLQNQPFVLTCMECQSEMERNTGK